MKHALPPFVLLLGAVGLAPGSQGKEDVAAAGEMFRERCIQCHQPPDPAFEVDRAWLNQVKDTAWTSTPERVRGALVEYLKEKPLAVPEPVTSAPTEPVAALATITPGFERGALILRNAEGRFYRLSWEAAQPGADRRRALPAGKYALAGYRLVSSDSSGKTWHVSATAPSMRELELASGQETRLEIDPTIRLDRRLNGDSVQVSVQGEARSGLSMYKEGKRIPLGFELLDHAGKKLADGKINYGWGGGGWAQVAPGAGVAELRLVFDKPPFPVREGHMAH